MEETKPYFSIVIAVRNREKAIVRCLDSILGQDFDDIEVIPVDGNSTDGTVAAIESLGDPRVRVVVEQENSGMWGARNLGFEHARGEWVAVLDSDDEMTEGALRRLYDRAVAAPADVGIIGASYRDDDGHIHPTPAFPEGPIGLDESMAWADQVVHPDYLHVFRKELLETEDLPPSQGQGNYLELKVFDRWRKDISADICGLYHTDADDRLSGKGAKFDVESFIFKASQSAAVYERVLRDFGKRMKRQAPGFYKLTCHQAGLAFMAAGRRWRGAHCLLALLRRRPWDLKAWGTLCFGLLGVRVFVWARRRMT